MSYDPNILTLGFARRVATYKRANAALPRRPSACTISPERIGGLQILFAGKAHPADNAGKALIREVFADAAKFQSSKLRILYLENYDWDLGQQLTNGVDVWLNTPRRPYEASGTSGMKAALNGVPSLSVLDGWWIEGCAENVTGWAIDDFDDESAGSRAALHQARDRHRAALRQQGSLRAYPPALHRDQRNVLQHPPHARPVRLQRLLPAVQLHRLHRPGDHRRSPRAGIHLTHSIASRAEDASKPWRPFAFLRSLRSAFF